MQGEMTMDDRQGSKQDGAGFASMTRRDVLSLGVAGSIAAAFGGLSMPGSARAASAPPSAPKGQVVIGLSQEPTVFHPLRVAIEVDQGVWWCLFDPLWGVDPKGNLIPRLAKEVPTVENGGISADGLSWRVKLRDDVKWHDGQAFTAEDVKFTLELINNPKFAAGNRQGHNLVTDIQVVSPHEITWKMKEVYSPYASALAWTFMVPKHILGKDEDPNNTPFVGAPVGTGPFKWGQRVPGDRLELLANTAYYGPGPYLERVIFKYIPDLNGMYTQFRTGQIDHLSIDGLPPNFYAEAKKLPGLTVVVVPSITVEYVALNMGNPVFADKAVRQALYTTINKKGIVDTLFYGLPTLTESFMPKDSWMYNPDLPVQHDDIKAANKLLDDAGWKPGADGVREKNGVKLSFTISTTSGNALREQIEQLLQQDWKSIGVDLKISNLPAAVMWGDFWVKSKFDAALVGSTFLTGNDPDCSYRFNSQATPAKGGSGSNVFQYVNPEVDALLAKGRSTMDRATRADIYRKIQAIVRDDLPMLPIFQYAPVQGYKNGLVGFEPNTNVRTNVWNVNTWYWA